MRGQLGENFLPGRDLLQVLSLQFSCPCHLAVLVPRMLYYRDYLCDLSSHKVRLKFGIDADYNTHSPPVSSLGSLSNFGHLDTALPFHRSSEEGVIMVSLESTGPRSEHNMM